MKQSKLYFVVVCSIIFMLFVAGRTGWFVYKEESERRRAEMIVTSMYALQNEQLSKWSRQHGTRGLIAATAMKGVSSFTVSLCILALTLILYSCMAVILSRRQLKASPDALHPQWRSKLMIAFLDSKLNKFVKIKTNYENPYPLETMTLRGSSAKIDAGSTHYEAIENRLICVLDQNKEYPADVAGHHGVTSLFDHSLGVYKRMRTTARAEKFSDPLVGIIALAHDIAKILVFKRDPKTGQFVRSCKYYQQLSATVLLSLEETKVLPLKERNVLSRVLRYSHGTTYSLPNDLTSREKNLIRILKFADGEQTKYEQGEKVVSDNNKSLWIDLHHAVEQAIPDLDINATGRADGWSMRAHDFVVTSFENLLCRTAPHAPNECRRFFGLDIAYSKQKQHKAEPDILNVLETLGILRHDVSSVESSSGLFDIKISTGKSKSGFPLTGAIFIDKSKLAELYPGLIEQWGSTKLRLIVQGPHGEKVKVEGDQESDAQPEHADI